MEKLMSKVILDCQDVSKSYANEGIQNHVLKHIDLEIRQGEFTVIMGPSGSGKSTLLYCISGMESCSGGAVCLHGNDITKFNENRLSDIRQQNFGFVFQQIHLVSNLSLFENVVVPGLSRKNSSNKEVYDKADKLLQTFLLEEAQNRLPAQVSGGEQQRAAIARALINQPDIIFADEPTGALNQNNSTIVLDLFTRINQEGQTIVMVTHDRRAALRGGRIVYLLDGRIHGELTLAPYDENMLKSRETQVNAWLESLAW